MNIKQAKDYIENTVRLYLKKDEFGEYRIPVVRQRPVFLLGAPGIGKTAIMEQIAQELSIALVSYSMTHHTRQSALGLPFISHREYEGMHYDVSEYTMSEIIASLYETMEKSGLKEGILFLDEINCVSETLAPSMLQFLQYKVFGKHKVPEGWIIVTAGNPPEYNKSVREFDVVTMDRLKLLEVEPDYQAFREYAHARKLHTAILNFLEIKKDYFYRIETTVNGRDYVTARGWEDLSQILYLYEEENYKVEESLVGQYLHNEKIVREFTAYYDLFRKYKKDYRVEEILQGTYTGQIAERARLAAFDERLSLLGMLNDKILSEISDLMETADYLSDLRNGLKAVQTAVEKGDKNTTVAALLDRQYEAREKQREKQLAAGNLSEAARRRCSRILNFLKEAKKACGSTSREENEDFEKVRERFAGEVSVMQEETGKIKKRLENLFGFVEDAFPEGNEMLILVTTLTVDAAGARFIGQFGCDPYQKYSEKMLLAERQHSLEKEIEALDL